MKNLDLKNVQELNYDELRQVDGGFVLLAILAGVTLWECFKAGLTVGTAAGGAMVVAAES